MDKVALLISLIALAGLIWALAGELDRQIDRRLLSLERGY